MGHHTKPLGIGRSQQKQTQNEKTDDKSTNKQLVIKSIGTFTSSSMIHAQQPGNCMIQEKTYLSATTDPSKTVILRVKPVNASSRLIATEVYKSAPSSPRENTACGNTSTVRRKLPVLKCFFSFSWAKKAFLEVEGVETGGPGEGEGAGEDSGGSLAFSSVSRSGVVCSLSTVWCSVLMISASIG